MQVANVGSNDGNVTVDLGKDDYAIFLSWKADTKKRNVAEKLKEAGLKAGARRQALVLRRVKDNIKTIAPDEDVAAYGEIHKLKNPTADPKQKTIVTDNEIKAYQVLDPDFKTIPTLKAITAKVDEMVAAGELTKEDDVVGDDDEPVQDQL